MIQFEKYILGPFQNNTYFIFDPSSKECVLIDPAIGSRKIIDFIARNELNLMGFWVTHAHFDHVAGIPEIIKSLNREIPVFMHPLDTDLWKTGGGSKEFGFELDLGPFPSTPVLADNMDLKIGEQSFQVLHTPGHSPGHVVFYCANQELVFCGDLIFKDSIGRTDLKGGNQTQIIKSVKEKIMTLPDETRLLCGHGEDTTVGDERENNPFI